MELGCVSGDGPFHKMLVLAFDGIASMSRAPLRLAYGFSLLLFAVFLGYILYVLYDHFILGGQLVPVAPLKA